MKKTWQIENLDCPNCAAKLERALNALPQVKEASVDFVGKTVTILAEDSVFAEAAQAVLAETARVEPETHIHMEEKSHEHEHAHEEGGW